LGHSVVPKPRRQISQLKYSAGSDKNCMTVAIQDDRSARMIWLGVKRRLRDTEGAVLIRSEGENVDECKAIFLQTDKSRIAFVLLR